jgi:transposase
VIKKEVIKQNVGVDIAKDDFKVCFSVMTADMHVTVKGSRTFDNNIQGFESLASRSGQKFIEGLELHFTMEATGVYYGGPAYFLREKSYPVHVVLPSQAKK